MSQLSLLAGALADALGGRLRRGPARPSWSFRQETIAPVLKRAAARGGTLESNADVDWAEPAEFVRARTGG